MIKISWNLSYLTKSSFKYNKLSNYSLQVKGENLARSLDNEKSCLTVNFYCAMNGTLQACFLKIIPVKLSNIWIELPVLGIDVRAKISARKTEQADQIVFPDPITFFSNRVRSDNQILKCASDILWSDTFFESIDFYV